MSNNEIPPITDPLGKYWNQPSRENILIDDEVAMMNDDDFFKLEEYNYSLPSVRYQGKMWKRNCGVYGWRLGWYGKETDKNIKVHWRTIVIV